MHAHETNAGPSRALPHQDPHPFSPFEHGTPTGLSPITSDVRDGWRSQARCVGEDPRRFTDPRPGSDDTRHAIATCQSCPVKQPCLDEALTHPTPIDVGIWGGTTPEQRALLRHRASAPVSGSADPTPAGLFATLDGELTDLTGRALLTRLPTRPHQLLLIDHRPVLRTNDLTDAWRHILTAIGDYQPSALAPLVVTAHGELSDPTGRTLITRLPTAPHLLVVHDDQPVSRHQQLADARQAALQLAHTAAEPRARSPRTPEMSNEPRAAQRLAGRR